MDLGASIVGITIILICIIPFVLISRNSRKKKQQLVEKLSNYGEKNKYKISRYDLWRNSAIGIDDTALGVVFTRKTKDQETWQQIDLIEIQKCRLINSGRTVSHTNGNHKVIERLELAFTHRDKSKPETILEFYNTAYDSLTLSGELQLAEKWCAIFNDRIAAVVPQKQ
ncbi:hypothetical protein [Runella sp.]|uniref:hypothetical protein n=1 Tax=Runella sp. TaxID=1960881 RepID=UPI003D0A0704